MLTTSVVGVEYSYYNSGFT